jgi:dynein heavy chain
MSDLVYIHRALLDVNIPKFTMNDIPLFENIISDLFPGIVMPERNYGSLLDALNQSIEENYLIPEPQFIKKCI